MESTLASRAGPLSILDSILDTRGTLYEADVFSVLRSCNFVLRGFEFAQADGALDCTNEYAPTASYADRLWDLNQRAKRGNAAQRLLLFDAKMASSRYAGRQVFVTINSQRKNVAFYIGICAANPAFVELIPNFYQSCSTPDSPGGSDDEDESRVLTINYARLSNLPPSAYTLNPDDSPYRMPLALLPEAIAGVRDCIRYRRPYVNPWTQAEFAEWAPKTTALVDFLQPREDSQHDTSYQAVMQMYRVINKQATQIPMSLELVSLQPRLADFKLLLHATSGAPDAAMPRQVFVQHKLDVQYRAKSSALTKVPIGRGPETDRRWYFEPFER
ncbi:MAG: hypothetical protein LQ349_001122 [Xanthoria aureola]|nr:MAG: hypothetical protein LQ349_001122 [Xanthoria aureola]